MTALDQAFIKAFSQQGSSPAPATLRPTSPRPNVDYRPTSAVADERNDSEERQQSRSSAPADFAPAMFERFDDILSALEKMPDLRGNDPAPRTDGVQAAETMPVAENVEFYANEFPSVEVDMGQWAFDDSLWATGVELPSPDVEPPAAASQPQPSPAEPKNTNPWREAANVELPPPAVETRTPSIEHAPTNESHAPVCEPLPPTVAERVSAKADLSYPASPQSPRHRRMFRPAWQVDRFTWPRVCRRLMSRATDEWDRLADALLNMAAGGCKVLAFAGCRRGEGATTLLLCAANRLAERGIKIAMLDADFNRPRLAKRMGIQPQIGWNETAGGDENNLHQAVVETADGNLALTAMRESTGEPPAADWPRCNECLGQLRNHYDLVLVDLGPLENVVNAENASWDGVGNLNAVLLVHNRRITPKESLNVMQGRLTDAGVNVAGVVENFVAI